MAIFHGSRTAPVAYFLRRRVGPKIIAVQHGPAEEFDGGLRRWACLALSRLADFTVFVSPVLRDRMAALRLGRRFCPGGRMRVIVNGVDEEFWCPRDAAADTNGPGFVVGMVGTLSPYKDQASLIEAVGQFRRGGVDVRLELAGAGSRLAELQSLVARLGLADAVAFLGDLSRTALRDRLHGWDVLAHITHSEGLSMALIGRNDERASDRRQRRGRCA